MAPSSSGLETFATALSNLPIDTGPCVAGCNFRGINFGTCTNAPAAPDDGFLVFSDADNNGSVATFSCDTGTFLDGDANVTCTVPLVGSTDWPSASTTCVPEYSNAGYL